MKTIKSLKQLLLAVEQRITFKHAGIALTMLSFVVFSCDKKPLPAPPEEIAKVQPSPQPPAPVKPTFAPSSKILVLKVDHLTSVFEGGTEINLSTNTEVSDSIPMSILYNPPGDFGDITLKYLPTGDSLFAGTIIWMGQGDRQFPAALAQASTFATGTSAPIPAHTQFQPILTDHNQTYPYATIWSAIQNLSIIQSYLAVGKKVAVYHYTPSVGIGNPADWDWYVFMSK